MLFIPLFIAFSAVAQNPYMALNGVYKTDGQIVVSTPRTTLIADLTTVKQVITCGPYARYAQKFLGVRAPLTDKTTYELKRVTLALADANLTSIQNTRAPKNAESEVLSHSRSDTDFARIQPDKMDIITLGLEDAAREAAMTIFSLRKHRMELITGEAGENVFGEGLKAALSEIARQEQSYLELFLGKCVNTTSTARYYLSLKEGKNQYVICRFASDAGILPESDLSGDMVLLQITPSGETPCPYEASARDVRKASGLVTYRIADPSECTVVYANQVFTSVVLPLFEMGRTVNVLSPRD